MNVETWIRSHRQETFIGAALVVAVIALAKSRSSSSTSTGASSASSSAGGVASATGTVPAATMDTTDTDLYNQVEAQVQGLQQQMQSVEYAQTVAGTPTTLQASNPTTATPPTTTASPTSPTPVAAGA